MAQHIEFPENSRIRVTFSTSLDTSTTTVALRVLNTEDYSPEITLEREGVAPNEDIVFNLDTSPLSMDKKYTTEFIVDPSGGEIGAYPNQVDDEDQLVPVDFKSIS